MIESHIHIRYETDEELNEYLDSCGTFDVVTGKKIVYEKVPTGQGTTSMFEKLFGDILDALCDLEELKNQEDTKA